MKKVLNILVLSFLMLSLSACLKTQHSIRIKNEFTQGALVKVGTTDFGLVSPGKTTSYQNIPEGSSQLGGDLQGSVSVSGKGKVK